MNVLEQDMLLMLDKAKKVFLLEPSYKRKYIPLGLAKIASYVSSRGADIAFGRAYNGEKCDLVCVTSLFTYDSQKVKDAIDQVRFFSHDLPVLAGGISVSLVPHMLDEYDNVFQFRGYSKVLDACVPMYDELDWGVESPWNDFSFVFTSRGCPNRCPYCAVWRLEPDRWITQNWKDHVIESKPCVMVSDNNLSSCDIEHVSDVIDYLANKRKKVVFDNGFDCKFITEEMACQLARLKFVRSGMRLAFDRIEEDSVFQNAVKTLVSAGVPKRGIMAYVLFNFNDSPKDADYRARECANLGIRPYPQRYTPLNWMDRDSVYVGKLWTSNLSKAFRYFWLMAGHYTRKTFDEYLHSGGAEQYKFDESDWNAWIRGKE